jgi:diadenosine tetraphosphate (Ap4A) HIT family hydrolase
VNWSAAIAKLFVEHYDEKAARWQPCGHVRRSGYLCVLRAQLTCLLAPLEHRVNVVADFSEDEYANLQRRVYRLGRALSAAVPTERLYVLSLRSHQGNAHVHWHLAPLPPGVPYEQQQVAAMTLAHGYLDIPAAEQADLTMRIRRLMEIDRTT